jgi:hypothetical protein
MQHLIETRRKAARLQNDEAYGDADKAILLLEKSVTDIWVENGMPTDGGV